MQPFAEITRVRDGLVEQLWNLVDQSGSEYTEVLARIDTLNWVLTSEDEPKTVEGPAMTLHDLLAEDTEPPAAEIEDPPVVARTTLADTDGPEQNPPPSLWETLAAKVKQGTDAVIHSTGHMTPTEILDLGKIRASAADPNLLRLSPTYSAPAPQGGD